MNPFTRHRGVAAPLLRINVDTDAIIPSREMKTVGKRGLVDGLFAGWRYRDAAARTPDPDFVLNRSAYAGATILLSGHNFGCGSSREHAVWALAEYGIRCVIAPSFGAIFRSNCIRNGLLPLVLDEALIHHLAALIDADPQVNRLDIDLTADRLTAPDGIAHPFSLDAAGRMMLLEGLDEIGMTLKQSARIDAHIEQDRMRRPWVWP